MLEISQQSTSSPVIHTRHDFNSFPAGATIRSVHAFTSYQSYHDFRDAILAPPTTLTTHNPRDSSGPTEHDSVRPSNHRRANTEVIPLHSFSCTSLLASPSTQVGFAKADSTQTKQDLSEKLTRRKFDAGKKSIANWLQGTSESVALGVLPSPTKELPFKMNPTGSTVAVSPFDDITNIPASSPQFNTGVSPKRMTAPSTRRQVASSTRFPWFGSKAPEPTKAALPEPADDEFLNFDITEVLFPKDSNREYSPAAFENLQANTENILRRLQATYKERTFALHEVLAEKTAQQEELAEARARIQHVKIQLDGMAERVHEHEKTTKILTKELEKERQARREEVARRQSVVLVPTHSSDSLNDILETPRRHVKRPSSSTLTSDSAYESGDESSAESVFSRRIEYPGSPLSSVSSPTCSTSPEVVLSPTAVAMSQAVPKTPSPAVQPSQPRRSAYDRMIKGLSPFTNSLASGSMTPSKCSNCHGVRASEAWSVLGVLQEENKGLKTRIGDLEAVIDDCLGLVGG